MKPYLAAGVKPLLRSALLVCFLVGAGVTPAAAADSARKITDSPAEADPLTRSGFEHFYNLEYDAAIADFEKVDRVHPDDAFAVNHLLNAVLFRELYRVGALDTSLYSSNNFVTKKKFDFDPKVKERVEELMARSFALSERRLKADPADLQALYTRGITRGMRATYLALVEKAWFAALRSAIAARHDHEKVLEMQPDFADAKTIVGVHNYVAGSLPWAIKVAVSVVGLSGSKQKGLKYLYAAADGAGETAPDAKITLALFLRREQRFDDALKVVRTLTAAYPRNSLFAIEEGNILNAGGHGMEAIAVFRGVLEKGKKGYYKDPHLELAAFTLGEALRGQKFYKEAAEAYEMVRNFPHRDPELLQKAALAGGQMHDLQQERAQALASYNAVIAADSSSPEAEQARRFVRQPYRAPNP